MHGIAQTLQAMDQISSQVVFVKIADAETSLKILDVSASGHALACPQHKPSIHGGSGKWPNLRDRPAY